MEKELIEMSLNDAAEITKSHRKRDKLDQSPAYFIPVSVFRKIVGVPGVAGVNIYPALKDGNYILLLAPATLSNETDAVPEDILTYSYRINGDSLSTQTIETKVFVTEGPHPPPPTRRNKLNSD